MDQWNNKATVLKDLMELTQGEVHVNSENFGTTTKPQRVYVEEEIDEELQHVDLERLNEKITPDLKSISELLNMVTLMEENEGDSEEKDKQESNTQENQETKEILGSSSHKESNEDTKLARSSETVLKKQNCITSPKHGKILTDPASMFKKKASPKVVQNRINKTTEREPSININRSENKLSDCAEQLYMEFKTKEEAHKKCHETIWTKLYRDLEERDKIVLSKKKDNSHTQQPTQGAD